MISEQIDMICFNEECIANDTQLFLYESEEKARHAGHADDHCVNIHPFNFKRKYARQAPVLQEIKERVQASLLSNIDQTIQKVTRFLRTKLTQKSSEVYDKELNEFRVDNCQNVLDRVKGRDNVSYEINFLNCLFLEDVDGMKNHILGKMKKCEQKINYSLKRLDAELSQQFQLVIGEFDFMGEETKESEPSPEKVIKIEIQTPVSESSKMVEEKTFERKLPAQPREGTENDRNYDNTFETEKMNDIRKYFKSNKTKGIQKQAKIVVKPVSQLDESSEWREELSEYHEITNNVSVVDSASVYSIRNDADWTQLLKYPTDYQRLVVYYPLSEEDLLKAIKKSSPKEIYLNYEIKLSSTFIENIPTQILKQLEKFFEYWDHNMFYDEILNKQYFPTDEFRFIKEVNKIHYSYPLYNAMPKLTNVWISNYYDLEQLQFSMKAPKSIDNLRIQRCRCCNNLNQYAIGQIFRAFKEVHSLKSLVLKCEMLNAENIQLLKELTESNKKIECLILELQGRYIPRKIIESISTLPLKKLSINKERNNDGKVVYMDITPIVRIRSLQKLAMVNIFFTKQQISKQDIESDQYFKLDEKVARKISSLSELVFLDLFRCSFIESSVVERLKEKVKRRLYHLNLSYTSVDSSIIPELYLLPELKELNIGRCPISLKELFRELSKKPIYSVRKLSLFNYNGEYLDDTDKSIGKFSLLNNSEIEKISYCFPNLQYLNIAFCRQFSDLPDHKFKKLKYLCSNKEFMSPAKIQKMRHSRGIEVYLYDGVHAAWIVEQ